MSLEAPFFSFDREINRVVLLWNTSGVPPWICRFHRWERRSISSKLSLLWQKSFPFLSLKNDNSTSEVYFINLKRSQEAKTPEMWTNKSIFFMHTLGTEHILSSQKIFFLKDIFPRDIHQNSSKKDTTNASKNSVFLKANFGFCSARIFPIIKRLFEEFLFLLKN